MPLEALADSSRQRPPGSFDEFSAYPPIADYAFLSDCEVTALVAPSGSVEWMCLPKMDGPSVFGSMLDRDAGWFRFGPDDVSVPSDRRYLPGTMVLETSWDCGEGWLVVRECLVMGPWQHDHPDGSTHIRPPTDYDAEHMLLRTVRCVDGQAQLTLDCVPAFDYGRQHARWRHTEHGYTQAVVEPEGLDLTLTLTSDIRLGLEGSSARTDPAEGGRHPLLRAVLGPPYPGELRRRVPAAGLDRAPLAALAVPRPPPRPPLARPPGPQRAHPQGPDVRAYRRDRRRGHHLAARDTRRGA